MAKITLSLWEDKRTSSREAPVYLVIRHRSKRATVATGVAVEPKHWNDRLQEVRKTADHPVQLNRRLQAIVGEAQAAAADLLSEGQEPWPALVKARVEAFLGRDAAAEPEAPECFLRYGDALLESYKARGQISTYKAYRTAIRKLRTFWKAEGKGAVMPFEEITPEFLRRFQSHLIGHYKNRTNTVHKNMTSIRAILRQAQRDGRASYAIRPFEAIRLSKERTVKEKLTTEEVRRVHALELEEGSLIGLVRDCWMFAFFAGGMRFADVATMQRRHLLATRVGGQEEVRSLYRMGKTQNVHGVLLVDQALAILDRYGWRKKAPDDFVFPLLEGRDLSTPIKRRRQIEARNALANKYLKKIQKKARIETNLTFHLSRHSLAGYLLEQNYDLLTIQKILGHEHAQQTEHYLRGFKGQGPDAAMRSIRL